MNNQTNKNNTNTNNNASSGNKNNNKHNNNRHSRNNTKQNKQNNTKQNNENKNRGVNANSKTNMMNSMETLLDVIEINMEATEMFSLQALHTADLNQVKVALQRAKDQIATMSLLRALVINNSPSLKGAIYLATIVAKTMEEALDALATQNCCRDMAKKVIDINQKYIEALMTMS